MNPMYLLYEQYFDGQKKSQPYADAMEQLQERLALLDASLYAYYQIRQEQGEDLAKLRMRGLVITEEEFAGAIAPAGSPVYMLPSFRTLHKQLSLCVDHIHRRSNSTASFFPCYEEVCRIMNLNSFESFCLLLALAVDIDRRYERIFGYLQDNVNEKLPTLGLAFSLYQLLAPIREDEALRIADEQIALRRFLLEPVPISEKHSRFSLTLRARKSVLSYATGSSRTDSILREYVLYKQYNTPCDPLLVRQEWVPRLANLIQTLYSDNPRALHLYGAQGIGKRTLISHACAALNINICFFQLDELYRAGWERVKELFPDLILELYLKNAAACLYAVCPNDVPEDKSWEQFVQLFMEKFQSYFGFYIVLSEEKQLFPNDSIKLHKLSMELPLLTVKESLSIWEYYTQAVPLDKTVNLAFYSNKYQFSIARIQNIVEEARLYAVYEGKPAISNIELANAIRYLNAGTLSLYASRIRPAFTWDDLILGEPQREMLQYICDYVRYQSVVEDDWGFRSKLPYGRGLTVVFYGLPGTGKTMAVQVLANELNLDFYRVDLSQMVSKYVGETEKNITRLFHEAKNIHAALFFDEADAFFAKRTEISSSNDKNANNETAHLLQQLEEFDGLAILATNYMANMDEAFRRRIRLSINFPFPDENQRAAIWRSLLPPNSDAGEADIWDLARDFELSGSNIKEIVINAAYISAGRHLDCIDMQSIAKALQMHHSKHNKTLNSATFEKYSIYL